MSLRTDEIIPTRATLIERLKSWNDQLSWQDFFETYWRLIYNIAVKSGLNDSEAQEVVQETMIAVARHMPTFKYDGSNGSFKSWLLHLVRWRILDQIRKRKSLVDSSVSIAGNQDETSTVEKLPDLSSQDLEPIWDEEWKKNLFEAAVAKVKRRLDPHKYQIFDFYVNKEWAAPKVAETFGISIDQVYLIKHRVTDMIKHEVAQLMEATP